HSGICAGKAAVLQKTGTSARPKFVRSDRKPCVGAIGAAHDLEADPCGRRSALRRRARARETACSLKTTGSRWPALANARIASAKFLRTALSVAPPSPEAIDVHPSSRT